MKKTYLLLFLFFVAITNAQTKQKKQVKLTKHNKESVRQFGVVRCFTTEADSISRSQNPNRGTINEFEDWLAPKVNEYKRQIANGILNRAPVLTIPVVFHIITDGAGAENLSAAQIQAQIDQLNIDYRDLAGSTDPVAADVEIEFCLASLDPSDNTMAEPGINRVTTFGQGPFTDAYIDNTIKPVTSWDPNSYMNIWSANISGGLLGWAQFPDASGLGGMPGGSGGPANTDGVVALYSSIGSVANPNPAGGAYARGRTMTHEVGHWLGLRHIWGDGGCGVDDFCADTPGSDAANFGCPNTNSCTDSAPDPRDMVENYMDYTDDACMDIFTADQKARMRTVMSTCLRRASLASSGKCAITVPKIGFSIEETIINENTDCGYQDVVLTVGIALAPSANATVTFTTSGTAAMGSGLDFNIFPASVVFPAGSTPTRNVTVRIYNDGQVESTENILIGMNIATSGNAVITTGNLKDHEVTINDDDFAPSPSVTVDIINADFNTGANGFTSTGNAGSDLFVLGTSAAASSPFWTIENTNATQFAYSNDDTCNCNKNNDLLISPVFSLAGFSNATLTFDHAFADAAAAEVGEVRISIDGGATWTTIQTLTNTSAGLGSGVFSTPWVNGNTIDLAMYLGQTNLRIAFLYRDGGGWNYGMAIDNVRVFSNTVAVIQEAINSSNNDNILLRNNETVHWYDPAINNVMGTIQNDAAFDYGCTTVEVDRSQVSLGASTGAFIDLNLENTILAKTFYINSSNDTSSGNYTVSFYYTEAEVLAWETATGKSRTELHVIKVIDNSINAINASNFQNYNIEEIPVTTLTFGTDVVFQATFTSNLSGGYAIGPKTGINCGDILSIWDGSVWSNGVPSKITAVTFTGNYSSSSDFEACSITITNNVQVTINTGDTFIVNGDVVVDAGSSLTVENNAALRQIDDAAVNTGNIIVKRNATVMNRLDYTAWSTPVIGQQLQAFSPNTVSTRFYGYLFTGVDTPTAYQSVDATTNFVAGKGYMIRADNTYTGPTVFNGQFTGVPINGIVNQSVGLGYNVLGNPYPSPIDANTFLTDNVNIGALYFWTNTTAASGGVYPQNNFATYTSGAGGVAAFASGKIPNGSIQTGQGFYVQATSAGTVGFNNLQRKNASVSTQFYRNASTTSMERHRIWLNLNDANTSYNQILVGYVEGASNGVDFGIDAKVLDTSKPMLYNVVNNEEYVIQGKLLPFNDEDIVPLGLKALTAGAYTISIENVDCLFDNQDVFIKDNLNNIVHDLKSSAYSFTTQVGTFNNRFEIVYRSGVLSSEDFTNENTMNVFVNSNSINVDSSQEIIKEIIVFDVLGRKLYENKNINATTFTISTLKASSQALIVKVKLENGQIKTEKIIL